MRVNVPIIPTRLGNYQLTRKFNGIVVEQFGEAFVEFCSYALKPETQSTGKLQIPVRLRAINRDKAEFDVSVAMKGNWSRLNSGEILIWGRLHPGE